MKLKSTGRMAMETILMFHPEIQAKLDEIENHGWRYLYIDNSATAEGETEISNSSYRITWGSGKFPEQMTEAPPNVIEVTMGSIPKIERVSDVQLFKINICSLSFPRAATVDLSKDQVIFLNDPFWKWETGSETDEKKLSDAKQVYEIATWLIDEKGFKPAGDVTEERWGELSYRFKKILASK